MDITTWGNGYHYLEKEKMGNDKHITAWRKRKWISLLGERGNGYHYLEKEKMGNDKDITAWRKMKWISLLGERGNGYHCSEKEEMDITTWRNRKWRMTRRRGRAGKYCKGTTATSENNTSEEIRSKQNSRNACHSEFSFFLLAVASK
jgi:hypothetical protein